MKKDIRKEIKENIIKVEYSDVMKQSYIDYAMSVIMARALPDVRDGLKPVQRRILYDMNELGVNSDKSFRKSARIVGDTMGKYHPHGDSSIYGAEVVMAQDFKFSTPLIEGQGNFGSIEGDSAAAQRYTECRLTKYTEKILLDDLRNNTIDYMANYDGSEKEPITLPCKLPNILINGSEGIAVGIATNMPPHNIAEVIDTTVKYIEEPKSSTKELLDILKGPDFPTGGIISNKSELLQIYETGVGKIKIRGKVEIEELERGKKNLIITEIPYTMIGEGIKKFLYSVASLVEEQTLDGIADISNQTSKDGIRIVIELKKNADIEYILNVLYKKTKLEDTFGVQSNIICNGKPETMSLKEILNAFMNYQYEIYTRKYTYLLDKFNRKKEIIEGLIKAIDVISEIIEVIRFSPSIKVAKECLCTGNILGIKFQNSTYENVAKKFNFTEEQAENIVNMRLSQLNGLEILKLEKEYKEIKREVQYCTRILNSKTVMKNEIKKNLLLLKEEFKKERKTKIEDSVPIIVKEREIKEENIVILIDRFGYVHAIDDSQYEKNKEYVKENFKYIVQSTNKSKLLVFTDIGKMHTLKPNEIPYTKLKDKGQPLDNISGYDSKIENIVFVTSLPSNNIKKEIIFVSTDAFVKRVELMEFDVTRRSIDATKLNDGQKVFGIYMYNEGQQILLGSQNGYYNRFNVDLIPIKKKNAVGSVGLKITNDEIVFGAVVKNGAEDVSINNITVQASRVKQTNRGAKGTKIRM